MTASGYPRIVKLWKRGTPLSSTRSRSPRARSRTSTCTGYARPDAKASSATSSTAASRSTPTKLFLLRDGKPVKIDKPDSANANVHREWLLLELRDDWAVGGKTYAAGTLLACKLDAFLAGERTFDVLFTPTERSRWPASRRRRNHVLLNVLDNVKQPRLVLTHGKDGGSASRCRACPSSARSARRRSTTRPATTTS
jgi:prolyl oligopeptidase